MHTALITGICCILTLGLWAQAPATDKSPMDVSYAPANYPILKFQGKASAAALLARVIYSRPQVDGRSLFGTEIKYNEVWRLGANESTELELFKQATVGGKPVPKGRYTLYCIPASDKWTFIINRDTHSWGAFSYQASADVARIAVPVEKSSGNTEYFTMYFNEKNHLVVMWGNLKVTLPIVFSAR